MKKILIIAILLCLYKVTANAQSPYQGNTTGTQTITPLTDAEVKKFIKAYEQLNYTEDEIQYMKTHSYKDNPNAAAYVKTKNAIMGAGFKDYAEFTSVSQKVTSAYVASKGNVNASNYSDAEKIIQDKINDPNTPAEAKEALKQQLAAIQRSKAGNPDVAVIQPYMTQLDLIYSKVSRLQK
jgi:hypothetical protein